MSNDGPSLETGGDGPSTSTDGKESMGDRGLDTSSGPGSRLPFPFKLYAMLDYAADSSYSSAVSWNADGGSFVIHNTDTFMRHLVPRYFKLAKLRSFRRQLNLWGFKRQFKQINTDDGWFHQNFVRGNIDGLQLIKRKAQSTLKQEPEKQIQGGGSGNEGPLSERGGEGPSLIGDGEIRKDQGDSSAPDCCGLSSGSSAGQRQMMVITGVPIRDSIGDTVGDWDTLFLGGLSFGSSGSDAGNSLGKRKRFIGQLSISGGARGSMGPKKSFLQRKRIMDEEHMRNHMKESLAGFKKSDRRSSPGSGVGGRRARLGSGKVDGNDVLNIDRLSDPPFHTDSTRNMPHETPMDNDEGNVIMSHSHVGQAGTIAENIKRVKLPSLTSPGNGNMADSINLISNTSVNAIISSSKMEKRINDGCLRLSRSNSSFPTSLDKKGSDKSLTVSMPTKHPIPLEECYGSAVPQWARDLCLASDCNNLAIYRGVCWSHGTNLGCTNQPLLRKVTRETCRQEGCTDQVVVNGCLLVPKGGVCIRHGGKQTCSHEGCANKALKA